MGQQATLDLAWAYYKTAERAQAIATLDRFIKLNPSSPAMDYALYMKGIVNFNEDLGLFGRRQVVITQEMPGHFVSPALSRMLGSAATNPSS